MKNKKIIFRLLVVCLIVLLIFCFVSNTAYGYTFNTSVYDNSLHELKEFDVGFESPSSSVKNIIGAFLNIFRIVSVFIAILLIGSNIIHRINYGKKLKEVIDNQKEDERISVFIKNITEDVEYNHVTEKYNRIKKCSLISIIAFFVSIIVTMYYSYYNSLIEISPLILFCLFLVFISIQSDTRKKIDYIEDKYLNLLGDNEAFGEYKIIKEKYGKAKAHTIFYIIAGVMLCAGAGILSIIQSFKPIIYLYPEKEQVITVELENKDLLTTSYPKYEDKWEILAKPNGDLVDLKTGRNLYALYWEGNKKKVDKSFDKGWCVKGEDSSKFLEEKLAALGLNEREAEEFIVYWLPKLEKNKYNLIKFETQEQINYNMPLNITPKPDTIIRVMMNFKGVNSYKQIEPQEIVTPKRIGFTVVEWGGSEIK